MRELVMKLPVATYVIIALTLGLAPFFPEPHVVEKLKMLASGSLSRSIDIFDLLLHGLPWVFLIIRLAIRPKSN